MYQPLYDPQLRLLQEEFPDDATIKGYVIDNMEGAVDQALFLSGTDIPIAVIGARGTGKMYIAKIVHQENRGGAGEIVVINCREFRNREEAVSRIGRALASAEGNTLVFKSPDLMNPDAQNKLARQLSTRILADSSPPRYLPKAKFVGLFGDSIEHLMKQGGLTEKLASVFAGYPIHVPPIKDRKQAVLRWAHKILGQECTDRSRVMRGFTPDAEKAMLSYDWPGNITEMRQRIVTALDSSDKEWLTPVDLGIYRDETASGALAVAELKPFLTEVEDEAGPQDEYIPTAFEELDIALAEAVRAAVLAQDILPLGDWLADEIILSVVERYSDDMPAAASFLHTRSRNVSRWLPRIEERGEQRRVDPRWRECRRLAGEWIRGQAMPDTPPVDQATGLLMAHLESHAESVSIKTRAKIMAVSVPTYQKRLKQMEDSAGGE